MPLGAGLAFPGFTGRLPRRENEGVLREGPYRLPGRHSAANGKPLFVSRGSIFKVRALSCGGAAERCREVEVVFTLDPFYGLYESLIKTS